jgi:hypothetical protein
MKDNLFDSKFTFLDAVKVLLLVVTAFSTWNVVAIMTPPGSFAFIRTVAAVGVVEGAFLGFEFATSNAKSARQVRLATVGFFCSLTVIAIFAGLSGLLEFGGNDLLIQGVGTWAGMAWTGSDVVMAFALVVLVLWIVALASIYRLYALADPEKIAELQKIALAGEVEEEARNALKLALDKAKPVIARTRAEAHVMAAYKGELTQDHMDRLLGDVSTHLANHYGNGNGTATPAPLRVPANGAIPADPEMPFLPQEKQRQYPAETHWEDGTPRYHPGPKSETPTAGESFRTEGQAD